MISSKTSTDGRPITFYDRGCGLCRREIAHYRAIDRDNRVEWVDINTDRRLLDALGVSHEQAMKRMHVLGADGVLRDGAAAFVALWSALPYYRFLARLVYFTRTTGLLEAAYRRFASWRYTRRRARFACAAPQCTLRDERL